jgi:type II secretory ATPase GspE/PulE/Tfp pilus assembly ATPase PilB-like protein
MQNGKFERFKFGELCVRMGFMTREQIEFAISKKEISKERIGNIKDEMKEIFMEKMSITAMKKKAKEAGATFLREAALELVINGETSISEANRVTFVE